MEDVGLEVVGRVVEEVDVLLEVVVVVGVVLEALVVEEVLGRVAVEVGVEDVD